MSETKMKIRSSEITMSAVNKKQYPSEGVPEIAFAGRSNVGKSSVINGLLNRKNFARTSSTPGKTRTINFYLINNEFYFVDLPGYGYARVSKTEKEKWGSIMERYLEDREELCAILLLVDVRHEPTADDKMMYDWIKYFGYNCVVVATKADKISRGQHQKHISVIRKKLEMPKEEKVIVTSSSKKTGIDELWDEIVSQYEEHGYTITYGE
ncbi:GTP-binding protein [Peptostreptococcus sp. D1]|nr:ribosome biogenesis GTP-binding protein YihA/YsxC [Peptostreptococcus sp. D1]SFE26720.1 GTP-binding protein [Peptostreptococcus sp. D1]